MSKHYDIIINGGGIVGFTLLNLIKKSPHLAKFKVLLIEQAAKPNQDAFNKPRYLNRDSQDINYQEKNVQFSNRVSSISPESRDTFHKLGTWSKLSSYSKNVRNIQVWNYDPTQRLTFSSDNSSDQDPHLKNGLFSIVENDRLVSSLIDSNPNYEESILWQHNLIHFDGSNRQPNAINVTIQDKTSEHEIEATGCLLLGCDGFKSKVRTIAGIQYREEDLKKRAVVGTVRMSGIEPGNEIAYQRFSNEKDSVAALLPLDENYSSFVISAPEDYAAYLESLTEEGFVEEFNTLLSRKEGSGTRIVDNLHGCLDAKVKYLTNMLKFNTTLGAYHDMPYVESVVEGSRASFPLLFGSTSPRMIAKAGDHKHAQIALLGDSTHRIHPLAGQGLNLGLQDAKVLVNELENIVKCGENPFTPHDLTTLDKILKNYECKRQTFLIPMTHGIMAMPILFKLLPSSFLTLANKCSPIKDASIRFASGSNIFNK